MHSGIETLMSDLDTFGSDEKKRQVALRFYADEIREHLVGLIEVITACREILFTYDQKEDTGRMGCFTAALDGFQPLGLGPALQPTETLNPNDREGLTALRSILANTKKLEDVLEGFYRGAINGEDVLGQDAVHPSINALRAVREALDKSINGFEQQKGSVTLGARGR